MEGVEGVEGVEGRNEMLLGKKRKMKKRREDAKMTLHCLQHPFFCNPSILLFSEINICANSKFNRSTNSSSN